MIRAWLAGGMACAGVWLLISPGVALLAAGLLVYVTWGQLTTFGGALQRVSGGFAVISRAARSACHIPPRGIRGILG